VYPNLRLLLLPIAYLDTDTTTASQDMERLGGFGHYQCCYGLKYSKNNFARSSIWDLALKSSPSN